LKRIFKSSNTGYIGIAKVQEQEILKYCCYAFLKAVNRISVTVICKIYKKQQIMLNNAYA